MPRVAFMLACLACVGCGRQLQSSIEQLLRDTSPEGQETLKALSTLLLASHPEAAFNPSNPGVRSTLSHARPVVLDRQHRLSSSIRMQTEVKEKTEKAAEGEQEMMMPWVLYAQDQNKTDPLDPSGQSEFVMWYRWQSAIDKYEKENPRDPVKEFGQRLAGPARTLAVLVAGYYLIPLLKGIIEGVKGGNLVEAVQTSLSDPTAALRPMGPTDTASAS
mmetsp:Transcript_109633/g.194422  ORF Transcript_109633/g.194422 Transcript_109633/m.194422 type:complete len:218 (+) Transcript_109633:64-717(+)